MVTRSSDGIPVGLSIVLYLVSNVRNTLVILTFKLNAHNMKLGTPIQILRAPGMTLNQIMHILRTPVN